MRRLTYGMTLGHGSCIHVDAVQGPSRSKFFFEWTNDAHGFMTAQASNKERTLQHVMYARHWRGSVSYRMLVVFLLHSPR